MPSLNWFEDDLRVNGTRLHYYRSGGNKPPLVLVHGFTDNALYWTRTAQALEADWDVILYDARGHGLSDRAGGRFGDAERTDDLIGLITALKLQKPGLMGHSMGAATIALVAAQQPELPHFIILEDPAWFEPPTDESAEDAARRTQKRAAETRDWREWVQQVQTRSYDEGLALVRAHSPQWSEVDAHLSLNARRQVKLDLFDFYPSERSSWRPRVPRIQCPGLLITGEPQRGGLITPEQAREIIVLWRHGRWVQIRDAGHSIRYDQFERYMEAVTVFLQSQASSPPNSP